MSGVAGEVKRRMAVSREYLGRFVAHDLMTPQPARSLEFYGSLFPEWQVEAVDLRESGTYHVIRVGGLNCGGVAELRSESASAAYWLGSVQVEDAAIAADRAGALGGGVTVAPVSSPDGGGFAVLTDPQQARIRVVEPVSEPELPTSPVPGHICWNELLTSDVASARKFYQAVFGWSAIEQSTEAGREYTLLRAGERDVAGIMSVGKAGEYAPTWFPWVYVDSLDSRFEKAVSLGGQPVVAPRDLPDGGRFCVLIDGLGALFAMMTYSG